MNSAYLFVFILSFVLLFILRKVAKRVGLVDKPNARKLHQGVVPLVGGISIYLTLLVGFIFFIPMNDNLALYLVCSAILIVLGALDDYYDVSFKIRLAIQASISLAMIHIGGHSLHDLGYLMGSETIALSEFAGTVITVIAVIGAINAFNMASALDALMLSVTVSGFDKQIICTSRGDRVWKKRRIAWPQVTRKHHHLIIRKFKLHISRTKNMPRRLKTQISKSLKW